MATEKRKSVSWNSYRRGSCTGVFSRSVMSHSAAPWTVDCQNPLPMKSSRQEYWSGVPFPTPEDLPHPGIEPTSRVSCVGRQIFFLPLVPPRKPLDCGDGWKIL